MKVTDSALKELEDVATFSEKAELCVWGRETRRLRDWEMSLLAIRRPELFNHCSPDDSERYSEAEKKIRLDCELCLGRHLAEACKGDGREFENLCKSMARADAEHRKRDPWTKLQTHQKKALERWLNEGPQDSENCEVNCRRVSESFREQGLAWAKRNALRALQLANVATHPVHAAVLMFSRTFSPDCEWSMREYSRRAIAEADGFPSSLPSRLEKIGIKNSRAEFDMFERNTAQAAVTASALHRRLEELLLRNVSPKDVREAASVLGIALKPGAPGAKLGRKPAPRKSGKKRARK